MGIIKSFLLVVLVIVGIGAGLIIAARHVPQEKWNGTVVNLQNIQPLIASSIENAQLNKLSEGAQSITGKVLGVKDSKSETDSSSSSDSASIPQKTFDFARYSYCKEVVKQYEAMEKNITE